MQRNLKLLAGIALIAFGLITIVGIRAKGINLTEGQMLATHWNGFVIAALFVIGGALILREKI